MSTLRVRMFGRFSVQRDGPVLDGLDAAKVKELFSYLLLYRSRPHPRESLAELLWSEGSADQARKHLRQVLWLLQTALDADVKSAGSRTLLVEPNWVGLNPDVSIWLDVAVFEEAAARVRGVPGPELDVQAARCLQDAVGLYTSDLLEGWYQDWCIYERERLQNAFLAMLDKLTGYCEAHDEADGVLEYATRILRQDRTHERTHRRLMRLHYRRGDRAAALRQYERCAAVLHEEFGVKPDRRTEALHQQIRLDQGKVPASARDQSNTVPAYTRTLPEVLGRLNQLELALAELQRQVRQDIQSLVLLVQDRQ